MVIQWSEEHEVLTDEMGLPISRTRARQLLTLAKKHLDKSPVQIAISYEKVLKELYPSMVKQVEIKAEKFI